MSSSLFTKILVSLGICLLVQAALLGPGAFTAAACGNLCNGGCSAPAQVPPGCIGGTCVVSGFCGSCDCRPTAPPPPALPKCKCQKAP